jgi:hypothetical protein
MANQQVFTNLHTLDQTSTKRFFKFTIQTGGNQMVFGPSGCGKTEIAIQAAQEMEYDFVYLNLSVLEAPDLLGLPSIDEKELVTRYALPAAFPRPLSDPPKNHKGKILIVDEIDKAKPELQSPMLELFQYRSINGTPLDFHAVLATGNRPDEGAFSLPVSKALTNRCKVYQMKPQFDPWNDWAAGVGLNGLVIGFLHRNRDYFYKPDTSGDQTAYCSCSARSWANSARDLDFAQESGENDYTFQQNLVAGYVGVEAATKFQIWLEHYKEIYPMIDALVNHGKHPSLENSTMDKIIVTAIAAGQEIARKCEQTAPSKKEIDEVKKTVKNVAGWLKDCQPDIQIAAMKSTLTVPKITAYKMSEVPEFMQIFKNINRAFKSS